MESVTIPEGHQYLACSNPNATAPCEPGIDALERAAGTEFSAVITDKVRGFSTLYDRITDKNELHAEVVHRCMCAGLLNQRPMPGCALPASLVRSLC